MADVKRFSDAEINRLVKFYEQAEREILDRLNRALLRGNKTEYLAQMKKNIEAILQQLRDGNRTWCTEAIPRVYSQGLYSADAMLEDMGASVKAGFGAIHQQAAQVLAENAYQRFEDVVQVIGRQVNDIYRELALENVRGTVVGYDTWQQTAMRYREQLAERGVTGFKDRSGRMWNMRTYAEMVARTTTMEAHLQGTANRLVEQGHDLVKVSTHLGACELCQPWQGKILSITGKTKGYPTLEEAKAAGLFHPNCRHAYGLYIDLDKEIELDIEDEIEINAEFIGDIEEIEKWEEKYYGDWVKSLSKEEKEAFEYYTMSGGAQQINDYLRAPEDNKPDIDEPLKKAISLMENAIKRAVVPHDIMVHRSVSYNWLGEELKNELFTLRENFNVEKLVGREHIEEGFTSASLKKGTFGQAISINIQVPKGMHAAAIEDVSVVSNEHELLFPPGLKIKVVSAKLIKETGRIEINAVAIKEKITKSVSEMTKEELIDFMHSVDAKLDKYGLLPQTWNGKLKIDPNMYSRGEGYGQREWDKSITVAGDALQEKTFVHELLHGRSNGISNVDVNEAQSAYCNHAALEEGVVESLTKALCKKEGWKYETTSYENYVNGIREAKNIFAKDVDDIEFYSNLLKMPLRKRGSYLKNEIEKAFFPPGTPKTEREVIKAYPEIWKGDEKAMKIYEEFLEKERKIKSIFMEQLGGVVFE